MGKILADYPSSSNPGRSYHIIRGNDGVTCDCPAWRFNTARTCKHLQDYRKHLQDYLGTHKVFNTQHNGRTYTADSEAELKVAIETAVKELV
jgi:hypothetical protein